jgi:GTP-binding protein
MRPDVTLLKTAFDRSQFPAESLPEIAVAGRSNVGKSSLINRLVGNRIAHVGSKPGKTRSINFYRIEGDAPFILVDLPGYGFASRSKTERTAWSRLIESYVINRNSLALVISLIDFRHGLLKNDKVLQEWIKDLDIPLLTVFTKVDKIARGKRKGLLHTYIRQGLYSLEVPFLTSASDNDGTENLRTFLQSFVSDLS